MDDDRHTYLPIGRYIYEPCERLGQIVGMMSECNQKSLPELGHDQEQSL
jgi:hypothetical protein